MSNLAFEILTVEETVDILAMQCSSLTIDTLTLKGLETALSSVLRLTS